MPKPKRKLPPGHIEIDEGKFLDLCLEQAQGAVKAMSDPKMIKAVGGKRMANGVAALLRRDVRSLQRMKRNRKKA